MGGCGRVLIVEDEDDIRAGVDMWLTAVGFETLQARDGEEGLRRAAEESPDAILMDMLMPKMNGLAALEGLKASEQTSGIPVVMLSASLRDEQRALDAGARYFVPKPYDHKDLIGTVRAALA